jgi:hypothetical protein
VFLVILRWFAYYLDPSGFGMTYIYQMSNVDLRNMTHFGTLLQLTREIYNFAVLN